MLSVALEILRTKRTKYSSIFIENYLPISAYRCWNCSSNIFHWGSSRCFFILKALLFVSLMDAYGGSLISAYGGTCWVEVEDHFVRSFAILIHMNMHNPNIHMIGPEMSVYKKNINKKWVLCTKRLNRIAKKILQFLSHTFGYSPHFLQAIFWCILIFTLWVLSDILFIENCKVQTWFRENPQVLQVPPTTSRFW